MKKSLSVYLFVVIMGIFSFHSVAKADVIASQGNNGLTFALSGTGANSSYFATSTALTETLSLSSSTTTVQFYLYGNNPADRGNIFQNGIIAFYTATGSFCGDSSIIGATVAAALQSATAPQLVTLTTAPIVGGCSYGVGAVIVMRLLNFNVTPADLSTSGDSTLAAYFVLTNTASASGYIPVSIYSTASSTGAFNSISSADLTNDFNSGGLSTTTIGTYCNNQFPIDNSSIISATLTYIPNSLCGIVTFLVVPTASSLNQFQALSASTQQRFPFVYVASVAATWNSLVASSTANAPSYSIGFHDWGFGSDTPMGNVLPNEVVFSASTTETYFPSGTFDLLKALASIALVLTLVADIFFSTKRMMK